MNAIPTKYVGVQFRSRLEARWAAFFDFMGWSWDYEPLDLKGYIPDFVLNFKHPLLVEVKPLTGAPGRWDEDDNGFDALKKIRDSGWNGEGLLVGASLHIHSRAEGVVQRGEPCNCGLLFDSDPTYQTDNCIMYSAPFGLSHCCGGPVDCLGMYVCRRCGFYDGNNLLLASEVVLSRWREAGNVVQWKAPR